MNAKRFRATKTGGPDWNLVTRRLTTNFDTGDVIEDILVKDAPEDFDWYAPLNNPTNIVTTFWYKELSMEEQAASRTAHERSGRCCEPDAIEQSARSIVYPAPDDTPSETPGLPGLSKGKIETCTLQASSARTERTGD